MASVLIGAAALGACRWDPVVAGPTPDYSGEPVQPGTGIRPIGPGEDGSHVGSVPGSYEWWNFFAADGTSDLSVSAIFLPANPWDIDYRKAVHEHRRGAADAPDPRAFPLLQLNVTAGGRKVFTTIRNPPGTTADFSTTTAAGRIGSSTFAAETSGGATVYRVHIDAPDLMNLTRLRADLEFADASVGFAVDGGGIFGPIPGGGRHNWQFPVGLPVTRGHVEITDRWGRKTFERDLTGGGYTDHFWGEGLLGDVLDSWYFGRAELGAAGAAIAIWLDPRDSDVAPYGRVLRVPPGGAPQSHAVTEFNTSEPARGGLGLPYFGDATFNVATGSVHMRMSTPLVEDWPFQVAGPGRFDVHLDGDITASAVPGPAEHLWQPGIDDPLYRLLASSLEDIPWFP